QMNPAPMPAIAAFYAGLTGLLLIVLALRVSARRMRLKVSLGDGGDDSLRRAIRVHANAVEWALPILLLLVLAELNRAPPLLLHICGIALLIGRITHALAVSRTTKSSGRFVGIGLNSAALIVVAVWDILAFVRLVFV
ncbi:MAG TPA: MAPEG family protein, partial [Casimicrobiaceae bacterium]|nr:MAPEG family protein [Casimicrobiaceae bacterium]